MLPRVIFCALSASIFKTAYCEQAVKEQSEVSSARIAVIGAGIGGSSASYFLRDLLGESAHIDVYESDSMVGGRLRTVEIGGKVFEAGGSIIHKSNAYMVNFVKDLGLHEKKSHEEGGRVGIWNGNEYIFMTSKVKLWTYAQLVWRYGILSPYRMDRWVTKLINNFENIYKLQKDGSSFKTVPDMLVAMGGDMFSELTNKTLRDALQQEGVSDSLIDELITGITRVNYGQSPNMAAFAGGVSLAGGQPGLWAVYDGNYQVCERLLKAANCNLHLSTRVTGIVKMHSEEQGRPLYRIQVGGKTKDEEYDLVIVATPLEIENPSLKCTGCTSWPGADLKGRFHRTVALFVQGDVDYNKMGLKSQEDVPEITFTQEKSEIYFNSIGLQKPVDADKACEKASKDCKVDQNTVWKVFSRSPLSQEQKDKIFSSQTETKEFNWLAYPNYSIPYKIPSFVLDDGVFYVNAIEWAASCMEMSAIGGKNAALLGHEYLVGKTDSSSSASQDEDIKSFDCFVVVFFEA